MRRPTKQQIATRLVQIAKTEGMHLEQNAAEMLVEQVGNDIRQSLNSMQMWRAKSSSLSYSDMKSGMARIEKDKILRLTPFDACGTILGGSKAPLDDRYNAFFIDYSLTPLLIQHNYIDSAKNGIFKNPQLDDVARMQLLSKAADAVSDSDLAGAAIRGQNMHWELLTTQAVFCVRAGSFVQGFQGMASFPAWLGKYSAQGKRSRLTKEIVHHTALTVGQVRGHSLHCAIYRMKSVLFNRSASRELRHMHCGSYRSCCPFGADCCVARSCRGSKRSVWTTCRTCGGRCWRRCSACRRGPARWTRWWRRWTPMGSPRRTSWRT